MMLNSKSFDGPFDTRSFWVERSRMCSIYTRQVFGFGRFRVDRRDPKSVRFLLERSDKDADLEELVAECEPRWLTCSSVWVHADESSPMDPVNLNTPFLAIAKDPRIIPGVHHHCDEWCEYCSVSQRCLGFRCTEEFRRLHKRSPDEPPFKTLDEAITFTHEVAAVEGGTTLELDALLNAGSDRESMSTSDPVASLALDYAVLVSQCRIPDGSAERRRDSAPAGPTAKATILWHHVRIYLRVVRALVARRREELGLNVTPDDAAGSGKLILVAIEQSRRAWHSLRRSEDGVEIDKAIELLNQIEQGVDDRIPEARSFIRIGLDVPAAPV